MQGNMLKTPATLTSKSSAKNKEKKEFSYQGAMQILLKDCYTTKPFIQGF